MQQHGVSRRLSIHRPNLSVNEQNYAHVPPPDAHVRRSGRPARLPATWNTIPSEESVVPIPPPEQLVNEDPMPPKAKRRKGIRSSIQGYSFNVPRTRRQKKMQKAISLNQMPQSPLSAITEFTDSASETPVIAELPTELTPRATPDRAPRSPPQLRIAKTRAAKTASQEIATIDMNERPAFARSVSMTSTLTAPAEPLPPLPAFDIYKSQRHNEPWRTSINSLDTVGSSVLGTVFSSPSRVGTELTVPSANLDGMQTFDFGFEDSKSARVGVPPGRQTMQGFCSGKTGITSIRPSVEYNTGRAVSLESAPYSRLRTIDDTFRIIDARNWNFNTQSQSARQARHSLQDYGCILGKRNYLDESVGSPWLMPRRPASVASGNPYQWDLKPAFSTQRHSAGSSEAKRGHKRQNCVRIANLPFSEPRNSRVEQMPELQEEQTEASSSTQVKIPGLTLLEAGQPVLRARASLVDVKGSPSPLHNRPVLVPTKPKQSLYYRTSNSSAGLSRPDSDVFSTGQPDPRTPETLRHSTRHWPLSPTSPNNIKLNSAGSPASMHVQYDSPTLPSPINAANVWPRKSRIMGPRNPPPSGFSPRTGSPSPVGSKVTQKRVAPDDLRKSIMALRSMNSEGRLLDAPSSRNYRAIGEEREDSKYFSVSPTMNSLSGDTHPYPRERRYGSVAFGARSKMSIAMSPSGISLGGTSIWEDASVRGDSPEPELPTILSPVLVLEDGDQQPPQTPKIVIPYPDPEAYENMGTRTYGEKTAESRFTSPQGKGLGLRIGNTMLGTPGSLYDRDGFLKE